MRKRRYDVRPYSKLFFFCVQGLFFGEFYLKYIVYILLQLVVKYRPILPLLLCHRNRALEKSIQIQEAAAVIYIFLPRTDIYIYGVYGDIPVRYSLLPAVARRPRRSGAWLLCKRGIDEHVVHVVRVQLRGQALYHVGAADERRRCKKQKIRNKKE